jgi:hypothetical protein
MATYVMNIIGMMVNGMEYVKIGGVMEEDILSDNGKIIEEMDQK